MNALNSIKELVDTTGAGDLFAAGFLFGLVRNAGHEAAWRGRPADALAACITRGGYFSPNTRMQPPQKPPPIGNSSRPICLWE